MKIVFNDDEVKVWNTKTRIERRALMNKMLDTADLLHSKDVSFTNEEDSLVEMEFIPKD